MCSLSLGRDASPAASGGQTCSWNEGWR